MAPLSYYHSVLEEEQSRIASYDCLERPFVCGAEGIFGSRHVYPTLYVLLRTCREAIEGHLIVRGILVYLVYVAEVRVVGIAEMRRYKQEGVALMTEHCLRDVLSRAVERYGEVVDGRLISCLCLHGLRVDELPCRVRIVLKHEFLRLSVLLHDECGDKLRLFCSLRYLHTFLYVRAHTIGTEVECGEGIEAI